MTRVSDNKVDLTIDVSIFNEQVLSKVLYWLTEDFLIYWKAGESHQIQQIILEKKSGNLSIESFQKLKSKLNQDFIDFKNRDIINKETKDIRNILYVKAFANGDEFEDYNLGKD